MSAYRIHQSLVEKPMKLQDFWPMWGDKEQGEKERIVTTKEMYEAIKKAHKIN